MDSCNSLLHVIEQSTGKTIQLLVRFGVDDMKIYKLHFRGRTGQNELNDLYIDVKVKSHKAAIQYGKDLERPKEKYWFMGVVKG